MILAEDAIDEIKNVRLFSSLNSILPLNIIKSYSFDEYKINDYYRTIYTMDRVFGKTLSDHITNNINSYHILSYFLQCIYVILYSNLQGIFHNDLKGNNIMIETKLTSNYSLSCIDINNYNISLIFKDDINLIKLVDYGSCKKTNNNVIPIEIYQIMNIFNNIISDLDFQYKDIVLEIINKFNIYNDELIEHGFPTWIKQCINIISKSRFDNLPIFDNSYKDKLISVLSDISIILKNNFPNINIIISN